VACGDWDRQHTRRNKARRAGVATLLRLLEPRSPTRRRESGTRGGLNGQDTRWSKARRPGVATLLRLLEPRSEDAEAGSQASVRPRVQGW